MTEARLDKQNFIALEAAVVKEEAEMSLHAESKRESQYSKFFEVAYNTGAWSASSSSPNPTHISNERKHGRVYMMMLRELMHELPPGNEVNASDRLSSYLRKL